MVMRNMHFACFGSKYLDRLKRNCKAKRREFCHVIRGKQRKGESKQRVPIKTRQAATLTQRLRNKNKQAHLSEVIGTLFCTNK